MAARSVQSGRWFPARLDVKGSQVDLGEWATPELAELACDRARLHLEISGLRRPTLATALGPASPTALRDESEREKVLHRERLEHSAALERERSLVTAQLGRMRGEFTPRLPAPNVKRVRPATRYVGVYWLAHIKRRPWSFGVTINGKTVRVAGIETDREAAILRDRVALHHVGPPSRANPHVFNLPEEARHLGPVDLETVRAEIAKGRRARKKAP